MPDIRMTGIRQTLVKSFEDDHPDIRVRLEGISGGVYESKLMTQFAGGVAPDIIEIGSIVSPFMKKGVLMNLDPFIKDFNIDDFYPETFIPFNYKDGIYVIPIRFATTVLFYNKDIFDREGIEYPDKSWTWDSLLNAAMRLTKDKDIDGKIEQFGYLPLYWNEFIFQNGGRIWNEDETECLLNQPMAVEALQFLADLRNKYKVTPHFSQEKEEGNIQIFMQGKLAMIPAGCWIVGKFREVKGLNWDIAHVPKGKLRTTGIGIAGYAMNRRCKYPDQTWEFIKYLCEREIPEVSKNGIAIPSRKSVALSSLFLEPTLPPEHSRVVLEALEYARPFLYNYEPIVLINQELDMVWLGHKTAKEVCEGLVPQVNEILSKK